MVMHKHRSPFTAGPGGFGAGAFNFNGPQYGDSGGFGPGADGLNGMPYLAHTPTKPLMRSISRQRSLAEEAGLESLPPPLVMAQRILAGGASGMGLGGGGGNSGGGSVGGSGMQRGSPGSSYYGPYEGDVSMLSLLEDSPKGPSPLQGMGLNPHMNLNLNLNKSANQKDAQQQKPSAQPSLADTDSESDLCMQRKVDAGPGKSSRWQRAFGCLIATLPEQRRHRWEEVLRRCGQSVMAKHLLVVLQLLALIVGAGLGQAARLVWMFGGIRFRLWRTKFQLRTTMRHFLWRLTNAKGNDTVIFLIVVLATPWLFLISLVGFGISLLFSMRTGMVECIRQMRLRLF